MRREGKVSFPVGFVGASGRVRHRRQERVRYGFFLDHTADLLSQVLTGVGLGLSCYVKAPAALLLLVAYLAFAAYTFIRMRVFDVLQIAFFAVGPTQIRLLLIATNVALFAWPTLSREAFGMGLSPVDLMCGAMASSSFIFLGVQMIVDWRRLAREERSPADAPEDLADPRAVPP